MKVTIVEIKSQSTYNFNDPLDKIGVSFIMLHGKMRFDL
jgi:hypothetical protein